jgi:hypothetical protein
MFCGVAAISIQWGWFDWFGINVALTMVQHTRCKQLTQSVQDLLSDSVLLQMRTSSQSAQP